MTKRVPTSSGQPSGPTTESVPDGASSTTVRATSTAADRVRDAAEIGAAAAATNQTPHLAVREGTAQRDAGFLERTVAGDGSGEERREGEDDDMVEDWRLRFGGGFLTAEISR